MNYNEAKLQQLDAVGTYRMYGHPVDFDHDTGEEGAPIKRWLPEALRPLLICCSVEWQ